MLVFSCYSRSPRLLQTLSSAYISASFAFVRAENGRNDLQYYQPKHQFIHCQEEQMFGRAPNKRDVYCRTRHRETGQPSTQLLLSLMRGTCRQITHPPGEIFGTPCRCTHRAHVSKFQSDRNTTENKKTQKIFSLQGQHNLAPRDLSLSERKTRSPTLTA